YDALTGLHSFPTRRSSDLRGVDPANQSCQRRCIRYHLEYIATGFAAAENCEVHARCGEVEPAYPCAERYDRRCIRQHAVSRAVRSEEHTSELQSRENLVCR